MNSDARLFWFLQISAALVLFLLLSGCTTGNNTVCLFALCNNPLTVEIEAEREREKKGEEKDDAK